MFPDTPENRFYRYFLETLEDLILELLDTAPEGYLKDSLMGFRDEVNVLLSAGWLREVGALRSLPLNSQVLQKRGDTGTSSGTSSCLTFH